MKKRQFLPVIFFLFLFFLFGKGEAAEIKEYNGVLRGQNYKASKERIKKSKSKLKVSPTLSFDSILEFPREEKEKIREKVAPRLFPILKKGRISPDFPGVNKKKATINLIVRLKEGAQRKDLEKKGIKVRTKTGNIATVAVKLSQLSDFISNENILYIEPVKKLNLLNEVLTGSSIALFGFSCLDTSSSEDNYTFSAEAGEILLMRACPGAYGLDPYLELKDSSGNILAFDDNSGPGNSAEINYTFDSAGDYLIVIKSADPSGYSSLLLDYQLLLSSTNTKINLFDLSGGDLGNAFYVGTNAKVFSPEGEGVIVGIVDTGIDYKHEDFIDDTTGESRIIYIWDQTDSTGTDTPVEYDYGSEWTKTQIDNEIDGSPAGVVRELDSDGHGTHVAGISAGDGSATDGDEPAGKYKGMAPKANLIIVKTDLTSDHIIDGVNYIFSKATALGKPAVVNLSLGTHLGPHDGTSLIDQAMDSSIQVSGSETKGRAIVVAAGNEGSDDIHAEATLSPNYSETVKFFNSYGYLGLNTWHDGNDKYKVTFSPPSDSTLQDWEWGIASSGPFTDGTGNDTGLCWGTKLDANYRNNLTINLESPSIDLSTTTSPQLTFKHWYKTENDWDGGVVKISKDNGISWEKIYPEENGGEYPGYDVVDQELYTGFSLAKDGAYSDDSSGWVDATFDLSGFAGETILIKFTFHSDSDKVYAGWYIDDVEVKDGVTVILSEDFETDDGSFTTSINNSLVAKPDTNDWEWLGDGTGGVVHLNYSLSSLNNDYEILCYNSCREENGATWQMTFQRTTAGGDGHLDAWMFGSGSFSDHVSSTKTVGEPGTASSVITVGAYTTKYLWDATDGSSYYYPSAIADFGQIAYFSSLGPTRDERMKPDITAPGFCVCSSLSSDMDTTGLSALISPDDRHWLLSGTSMSSPAVAGAVALLLSESNQTASEIKLQLQLLATSSPDKYTPSTEIPNDTYGYGKLTLVEEETEIGLTSEEGGEEGGGGCFIATAAFASPMAKEVVLLKKFRDQYLLINPFGQAFTKIYYEVSPPFADYIRNKPLIKAVARIYLKPLVWWSKLLSE